MEIPVALANQTTTPGIPAEGNTSKISFGVVGFIIFAVILIVIFCVRRKCSYTRKRHNSSASSHTSNELTEINSDASGILPMVLIHEDVKLQLKCFLIDPKRLILERIIGRGQFGCVYEGFLSKNKTGSNNYGVLTHEKVAIKTIKGSATTLDPATVEAFLSEGMLMRDFSHPNILSLIGVALGDHGIPMIVLPFMDHGNLKHYISDPSRTLVVRDLLEFGRQVAHGMDYLGQQKFVHRDLAARNCMLDKDLVVKVADFGLSRDIYTKDYYSSDDKQAKLPVKWMAIECLSTSKYTAKSDVWSFGVLLWELMTRGATPYPDVTNWDVFSYIKAGRRMRQPENCPDEIYDMMLECWRVDPHERPRFFNMAMDLETIIGPQDRYDKDKDSDGHYVNLQSIIEAPDADDMDITGASHTVAY